MDLSVRISNKLHIAVITWAAKHTATVEDVVARALTEYMLDVDSGLLGPPRTDLRTMLGRSRRLQ